MSNAERQRQFRERHPGYYARLHARRRAGEKAAAEAAGAQLAALSQPPAAAHPAAAAVTPPPPAPVDFPAPAVTDAAPLRHAA
jgi:hypothetical protein